MTAMNKNFENSISTIAINTGINTQFDHVPSHAELAEIVGTSRKTVSQFLHKKCAKCLDGTKAHAVRTIAVNNGYAIYDDGTIRIRNGKEGGTIMMQKTMPKPMNKYLEKSNFPTKNMRNERMLKLREQGYTNEEIARKVGCSYLTVLNNIGKQPDVYTKQSVEYKRIAKAMQKSARLARVEALRMQKIEDAKRRLADAEAERELLHVRWNTLTNLTAQNNREWVEAKEALRILETA